MAPPLHGPPLPGLGGGSERRLEHQPPTVLRSSVPGLVPGRRRRARPIFDTPLFATEDRLPVDPSTEVPDGLRRGAAGSSRGFRRRPRRDGHLGYLVTHPADRRRMGGRPRPVRPGLPHGRSAPGPRDHPDLAVLDRGPLRARARLAPVDGRGHLRVGPRSGPQEDVEVQGQRGHPTPPAREARSRRRALLGRRRAPGHRHRLRRGPDESRAAAGHQDPQRLAIRPRPDRRRGRDGRACPDPKR